MSAYSMGYNVLEEIIQKNKEHQKKRMWQRIVTCLAAMVVFCTTYALILPAITMEDELTCGIENHVHDDIICYINNNADVETESHWAATLPKELTGDYRSDLVLTAESQLDYSESLRNLIIDEEESVLRGYSRYGAWAGDSYGDWNRYFMSFCLAYAGISEDEFPQAADYAEWIELLKAKELYRASADYTPGVGDILFLDMDKDGTVDRVALATALVYKDGVQKIKAIEGDVGGTDNHVTKTESLVPVDGTVVSNGDAVTPSVSGGDSLTKMVQYHAPEGYAGGKVEYVQYDLSSAYIVGYGTLPKQPFVYTYSDDNVQVVVKLPEDSSVPLDAVLTVTPIVSGDTGYDTLTEQAQAVVDGAVKQIRFYDISFYTAENEYIPVDERAKVTIRFKESMTASGADVVVLHYDEEESTPVVLEEVSLEEQEIAVETTDSAQALAADAAAVETVVAFETEGFSTFAVVEVDTGTYVTDIVEPTQSTNNVVDGYSTVSGLSGRTFVIASADMSYALTAINYVATETVNNATQNNDNLKGMAVLSADDATLTVNANEHLLWTFEPTGNTGTVYIRSVATGEYLNIIKNRILRTGTTKQEITVVMNDNGEVGFCVEVEDVYYYVDRDGGEDHFHTWTGGIGDPDEDANRCFVLGEYTADSKKDNDNEQTDGVDTDAVAVGNAYIIAAVNFRNGLGKDQDSAVILRSGSAEDGTGLIGGDAFNELVLDGNNAVSLPLTGSNNLVNSIWIFEPAGEEDTFYIRTVSNGQYLNISETALTTSDTKQAIKRVAAAGYEDNDVENAYCLCVDIGEKTYYVNLSQNNRNNNFVAISNDNGVNESNRGNHLVLLDQGYKLIPDLENKAYLISGVNFIGNENADEAVIMSSGKLENNTKLDGVHIEAANINIANAGTANSYVESITYTEANHAGWHFEYAGSLGTYYIRSTANGEYLNISDGGLTTSATKQAIEAIAADTSTQNRPIRNNVISLRSAEDHTLFVQLDGNTVDDDFIGAKSDATLTATLQNGGHHLVLTRYLEKAEMATDLGGKVYFVVAVNNSSQANPPLLASTGEAEDGINHLTGENRDWGILDEEYVVESAATIDTNNNLGWLFEDTETPGVYHLMAVNGTNENKYLNISAAGLTMGDTPQDIEAVVGTGTEDQTVKDVICLRANVDGVYYYVHLQQNNPGANFNSATGVNLIADRSNHFALSEIPTVNNVVTMIENLLANMVETSDTTYTFSDAAYTGSAAPNNNNNGQQGGGGQNADETFVDDYEQAKAYRTEMQELARAALAAYEALPAEEQRYVYNSEELVNDLKWLWSGLETVDSVNVNATVKLYNYDGTTNNPNSGLSNKALLDAGFRFYHKRDFDSYTAIVDANRNNTNLLGCNGSDLDMYSTLINGYPSVRGSDEDGITLSETEGSLEFLFDETYLKATMDEGDGGGLFRMNEQGFYYYHCYENAAHYEADTNRFVLYDTIVRPMYIHGTEPANATDVYNFLPFNDPMETAILDDPVPEGETGVKTAYLNERPDMWFGMTIEFDFNMPEGGMMEDPAGNPQSMIFKFEGDDDVLVYIDGVLVMDLAGVHGAQYGEIDFATGIVTDESENTAGTLAEIFEGTSVAISGDTLTENTAHKLQFFYMERGGNVSYNSIEFNMAALPQKDMLVGKEVDLSQSGENTTAVDNKYYTFRVIQADADGNALKDENGNDVSYFKGGTVFEIWKDGEFTDDVGIIDEDGYFSVRGGYAAKFADVLNEDKRANLQCSHYIVQEIIPVGEKDQYAGVSYIIKDIEGEVIETAIEGEEGVETIVYSTGGISAGENSDITIQNTVAPPLGELRITKQVAGDTVDSTEEFNVQVKLGDVDINGDSQESMLPIPVGTQYTSSDGTVKTVEEEGYITLKHNETITISGILAGTNFEIIESLETGQHYTPSYTGVIRDQTNNILGEENYGLNSPTGEFDIGQIIEITITNDPDIVTVEIPIEKQVMYCNGTDSFNFLVEQYIRTDAGDATGTPTFAPLDETNPEMLPGTSVTVELQESTRHPIGVGTITLSYEEAVEGTFYYKISEEPGGGSYIYDDTYYIIEVVVGTGSDNMKTAEITNIWKNGTAEVTELSFVNHRTTSVTITKTVTSANTTDTFEFEVTVTDENGNAVSSVPDSFTLPENGEWKKVISGIPIGAVVTVTEKPTEEYEESYNVTARYEAEYGTLNGNAFIDAKNYPSAGMFVAYLGGADGNTNTDTIPIYYAQSVNARMYIGYAADATRNIEYQINSDVAQQQTMPSTNNWYQWMKSTPVDIILNAEDNQNTIMLGNSTAYAPNLDYIDLEFDTVEGNVATVNVLGDYTTINFLNVARYQIPETGGVGSKSYILGGLLTMLSASALLLLYNKSKRRKKVKVPS